MTNIDPTGYCNNCQQRVLLTREKFNTALGILLFFFTGIGFFIYLIIFYNKPKDICIHCGTKVYEYEKPLLQKQNQSQKQKVYKSSNNEKVEEVSGMIPKFCTFCGEELKNDNSKYCPSCGTQN
jgi:hypothetical protein